MRFWIIAGLLDIVFLWLVYASALENTTGSMAGLLILMGPLINTIAIGFLLLFIHLCGSDKGDKVSRAILVLLSIVAVLIIVLCHGFTFLFSGG